MKKLNMTCHQYFRFCSFTTLMEVCFVFNVMSLFSGLFMGANADEYKYFCIYPTKGVRDPEKACCVKDRGYGILINKVRLSTRAKEFTKSECIDLYDDDETEDVSPSMKQLLENSCNGRARCRFGTFTSPRDSSWIYTVSYKCVWVGPILPSDSREPILNIMKSLEENTITSTAVLSMRVLGEKQPVSKTCHASGAKEPLTLKVLHLDLSGNQNSKSCSGLMNVTSGFDKLFSVNCSQTESKSYNKREIDVDAGKPLTLSLALKEGFVWLKIDGASSFTISCDGTTNEGKQPIRPAPNNETIPFPVVTKDPDIQPEPGKTYGTRSSTRLVLATTTSQFAPKEPPGSITIVVAVVSAIAGVATTIAVVLAIYLCKTIRDSPYQRWRFKRQSRNVAVEGMNARPKATKYANQRDQEYACVEPNEMRRSPQTTAAADSGMYDTAEDSTISPPLPQSPRPARFPDQAHTQNVYTNEGTQAPVGGQGMMYSEVVMMNPKDDSIKIYAPGFYHTAGDKEPIPLPGRDTYDVLGETSGQYAHLRDPAVKENYLPNNVYDG